jgi:hypothetical protein
VFENKVLRKIFVPQRVEIMGGRRKLHNEEFHNLYSLPSKIRMIRSRRIRWARHVARMGEEEECIEDFGERARKKETTRKN